MFPVAHVDKVFCLVSLIRVTPKPVTSKQDSQSEEVKKNADDQNLLLRDYDLIGLCGVVALTSFKQKSYTVQVERYCLKDLLKHGFPNLVNCPNHSASSEPSELTAVEGFLVGEHDEVLEVL